MSGAAARAVATRPRTKVPLAIGRRLLIALPGLALLLFWQWASGRLIREIYVSKPTVIFAARLFELFATGKILPDLAVTAKELVLSYVIGVTFGIAAGYVLGRAARLAAIIEPYVMAFYGIPKIWPACAAVRSSGSASASGRR